MDRPETPRKNSAAAVALIGILMLPLLYVLSLGPAVMIIDHTGCGEDFAEVVYYPLIWLHENTPLRASLDWYVGLWV